MLKKIFFRKLVVASSLILVMLMLYFIPVNKDEIDLNTNQQLEYVYPNDLEVIYLLDKYDYLSRVRMSVNNKDKLSKSLLISLVISSVKRTLFHGISLVDTPLSAVSVSEILFFQITLFPVFITLFP